MIRHFLAAGLMLLTVSASAQLREADTLAFGYRFGISGNRLTGNVERLLLISTAELVSAHERWAIRSSNTWQYGTFGSANTENDLLSRNFIYLNQKKTIYPYWMIWLETNRRRDFAFRYQAGPGLSWAVLRAARHQLKLSLTATWEQTWYNNPFNESTAYPHADAINTFRATARLYGHHDLLGGKLRLRYETWAQASLSYADNWRVYSELFLEYPLYKSLAWRSGYTAYWESVVPAGVAERDSMLTFGFSLANFN